MEVQALEGGGGRRAREAEVGVRHEDRHGQHEERADAARRRVDARHLGVVRAGRQARRAHLEVEALAAVREREVRRAREPRRRRAQLAREVERDARGVRRVLVQP